MVGTRTCNKNRRAKIKPNPSHIPFTAPKPEPVGSQHPPENKGGTQTWRFGRLFSYLKALCSGAMLVIEMFYQITLMSFNETK